MTDYVSREEFQKIAAQVSTLRKWNDTANSALWKRALFRLDGWPRAAHVADGGDSFGPVRQRGRSSRPWHRWGYLIGPESNALIHNQ